MHITIKGGATLLVAMFIAGIGGCATCKDRLLVHVENAETHAPIVDARIKFHRPMSMLLPPPVWRGKTDAQGNLRICVDFNNGGALVMKIQHGEYEYESMFGLLSLDYPGGRSAVLRSDRDGPEIRAVVQRDDSKK